MHAASANGKDLAEQLHQSGSSKQRAQAPQRQRLSGKAGSDSGAAAAAAERDSEAEEAARAAAEATAAELLKEEEEVAAARIKAQEKLAAKKAKVRRGAWEGRGTAMLLMSTLLPRSRLVQSACLTAHTPGHLPSSAHAAPVSFAGCSQEGACQGSSQGP